MKKTFDRSLLTFDPVKHVHYYNGERLYGVTTVLGIISKGDALVQWAVNQATEYIASELHGMKELSGVEPTPEEVNYVVLGAKKAWRARRQEAADTGTIAHNWIEQYLKGGSDGLPDNPAARNSCEAAVEWLTKHKWQNIAIEKQIFLPELRVAGILDWFAYIDGVPAIADWKTSNGIYNTYRYQTAAYAKAIENETGDRVRERWILRIDKNTGVIEDLHLKAADLPKDWNAFKNAAGLYVREKELEECKKTMKSQ